MARGFAVWFVVFSDCLAFLAFLAVDSSSLNRQDAKNAKERFSIFHHRKIKMIVQINNRISL